MSHPTVVFVLIALLVASCFEEDQPVPPYAGDVTTIADSVQTNLSYFDFETGRVVASHRSDAWQLGFECGPEGWHIITNSGDNWFIYNTRQTSPDHFNMPETVDHLFDVQKAYPDSTAVGNWVAFQQGSPVYTKHIYLLGKYSGGVFTQISQLAFLEVSDSAYRFYFRMQSGPSDTVTIVKNDSVNFVYFSVKSQAQVNLEPDKTTYDLVFGPYYDLATLFGMTIPYQVGGGMLNCWQTEALLDSTLVFDAINAGTLPGYTFNSQRDIPGYRWKGVTVDVSGGGSASYAVKTNYTYIFHTAQDNYFKLKFLSYTLDGKSGFPQFEFRQLE